MASFRSADNASVTIIIRPARETIPLPNELRESTPPSVWEDRIMAVQNLCAHYGRPTLERIHFAISVIAMIAVPIAVSHVIFRAITPQPLLQAIDRNYGFDDSFRSNTFDRDTFQQADKYYLFSRLASLGVFLGVMLVFWVPMIMWKLIGARRAQGLATKFMKEDEMRGASFIPRWTIKTPGVWNANGRIMVSIPAAQAPTLFAPGAYMPPYIIPAGQQPGNGYPQQPYGYAPAQIPVQGPEHDDEKYPVDAGAHGLPTYAPSQGHGVPELDFTSDEKRAEDFEEVKV